MIPSPSAFTWQRQTLVDAFTPRLPIVYAVDGLFEVPSVNLVYGQPGGFKSMLMADCCACVTLGVTWLQPMPHTPPTGLKTSAMPVVWLDFDNGTRRTSDRFASIGNAYKLAPSAPLSYVSMPTPRLNLQGSGRGPNQHAQQLAQTLLDWGAGFVVIDCLSLICGDADENSLQMAVVMGHLRDVAETAGVALVVIHHARKSNGTNGRKGDSLRGHSSIEAALDLALLVEREPDAESCTIRATKARGADVASMGAIFEYALRPGTRELDQARFYGYQITDHTNSKQAIEDAILDVLQTQGPLNQARLLAEVKKVEPSWGKDRVKAILDRMAVTGMVTVSRGLKNSVMYAVP